MRQRHDNFDFKKTMKAHNNKDNLIEIKSFLTNPNTI